MVRPHIEELLRLLPHFRLGVFSSATSRTVNTALGVIQRRLRDIARARGLGAARAGRRAGSVIAGALFGGS